LKNDIVAFEKSSLRKNVSVEAFRSTKIFNHFFYWGMLTVSGDCGHVHPTSVGERIEEPKSKPNLAHSLLRDLGKEGGSDAHGGQPVQEQEPEEEDDEVSALLKEMEWLRLEGNNKEADRIETRIHKLRLDKLKKIRSQ
jgi:hypothetical protein